MEWFHGAYATGDNESLFTREPPLEQNFLWKGLISSEHSQVPGRENLESAMILHPRIDSGVYSGIITYQATEPVNMTIWNEIEPGNMTMIPEEFGGIDNVIKIRGGVYVLEEIDSGTTGSFPFVGSAVELVAHKPFVVSYAVNALTAQPIDVSDTRSLIERTQNK